MTPLLTPLRIAALALLTSACAEVQPWEREYLSMPCMQVPGAEDAIANEYAAKTFETTTGAGLPGQPAGGGCGCTN